MQLCALSAALVAAVAAHGEGGPLELLPDLLPQAEAHVGKIHVTSAVLTGPDTIVVTYSGVIGPPTRQEDIARCGYFGCVVTGTKTVRSSAGQYSDVVIRPGGPVDIRNVRYHSPFSHTIDLASGFSAAPDASGSLNMPSGGTWVNSRHSHTRDAAQITVTDGQGPRLAPGVLPVLDLAEGSMTFRLNERIVPSSLDPSTMTIAGTNLLGAIATPSSDPNLRTAAQVRVHHALGLAVTPSSDPGLDAGLVLTEAQRAALAAVQDRAGGLTADIEWGAFADTRGNKSLQASGVDLRVTKDTVPPSIRVPPSSIMLGNGTLNMVFDEYIDRPGTDLSGVRLQDASGSTGFSLGSNEASAGYSRYEVSVQLSPRQKAQVIAPSAFPPGITYGLVPAKDAPVITQEPGLTSLRIDAGAFRDMAGIKIHGPSVVQLNAVPDAAAPALASDPVLYLGDGTLRVEFDEYVDVRGADLAGFSLHKAGDTDGAVTLHGASAKSDGDTLVLQMGEAQRQRVVAMGTGLVLGVNAGAIKDLSGNPIAASATAAEAHPDRRGPSVSSASLDTGTGLLSLEFDETVDVSRTGLSDMSLRSPSRAVSEAVSLWSGQDRASVVSQSDGTALQIRLTESQRSALAAEGAGTLYLAVGSGAARDTSGNPIGPDDMIRVNSSGDNDGPSALSASLHGGTGALEVTFNEIVDASSVSAPGLHLRGTDADAGRTGLASASVRDLDGTVIEITLTEAQRQAALSYGTVLLDVGAGAARDAAYNPVSAASVSVSVSPDQMVPRMESAALGGGILEISFSETVDVGSVDLAKMTLQEEAAPAAEPEDNADRCIRTLNGQYRTTVSGQPCTPPQAPAQASVVLSSSTEASVRTAADSETLSIALSAEQTAAVAAFGRAAQLDMGAGAVQDTSGNPVEAFSDADLGPVEPSGASDEAAPRLVSASVTGAHSISVQFSEDLDDASVEDGDFEVRGHVLGGVSEEDGTVVIRLQTRILNTAGETLRVTMSGSVSDAAGNVLDGSGSDVYADAPNTLNFADALVFTVASDNGNPAYARAGDTIIVTFEADVDIVPATKTAVTFNSRPASTVSPSGSGFSATYAVTSADREGPVDVSVSVTSAKDPATSAFGAGDLTGGGVTVDMTAPEYLSASLAGSQSMHVHYSERVATSAADYTAIRLLCDGCLPQDASDASNPASSSYVLVSWAVQTPDVSSTPVEFTVGAGVADLAGNPVSNPGRKEMQPPSNLEAHGRLQLGAGGTSGVALAHDTLVHTVVAPPGTVPLIDVSEFKRPEIVHDDVDGAGGGAVEFTHLRGLTVETDVGTVTFPHRVQAGGFPSGQGADYTITVDVSRKAPDVGFMNRYPDVDSGTALIFEFGQHGADLMFSAPVRVALSGDISPGATVFTIDAGGVTREVLACGASVSDSATAAAFIASDVAPRASPMIDGGACVDKAANTIWTKHFSAFGHSVRAAESSRECDDCSPPTLGVDGSGARTVSGGFSYNSLVSDVERFFTPYERITVQVGEENTARIKVHDDGGADSIRHVSLAFGLRSGQAISESTAAIAWDRDHAGAETVTITDPHDVLDDQTVRVDAVEVPCSPASAEACLQVSVRHTFRAPPDFDMVGVNVWDADRNSWQNYFNHGVHVEGESLNESPGVLVNGGSLRLYPVSAGASDEVMTDGRGTVYRQAPGGAYLPLTNASALHGEVDEWGWIQAMPGAEPSSGYDRHDPRFAGLLQAEETEALEALAAMTRGGQISNPEFGMPAPHAHHAQSYSDRSEDGRLQAALLAEQARAALLYERLFENRR